MAFKAQLKIGNTEFDVLSCNYELHREVDLKGRPAGGITGGKVDLIVESNEDTSIIEAMVNNQHKPLDGTVTFKKSEEDATMKVLSFSKSYVVDFKENFEAFNANPMTISFTISAQKLKIGNAEHANDWPK